MQDYPPRIATFFTGTGEAPTPDPDTRTPAAFLRWVLGRQKALIALSSLCYSLWFLPMTLGPWIFGRAVDEGIVGGSEAALLGWAGLLLVVVVLIFPLWLMMFGVTSRSCCTGVSVAAFEAHPAITAIVVVVLLNGAFVVVGALSNIPRDFSSLGARQDNAAVLHRAGARVVINARNQEKLDEEARKAQEGKPPPPLLPCRASLPCTGFRSETPGHSG